MSKMVNIVNGGGQKSLEHSNSNDLDQIYWPIVLRTQFMCM